MVGGQGFLVTLQLEQSFTSVEKREDKIGCKCQRPIEALQRRCELPQQQQRATSKQMCVDIVGIERQRLLGSAESLLVLLQLEQNARMI